jgi:hypothetical protein
MPVSLGQGLSPWASQAGDNSNEKAQLRTLRQLKG